MSAAAAVFVLSFPAAAAVMYLLLSLTARNGDGPWLAILTGLSTWLGIFLFALSIAI